MRSELFDQAHNLVQTQERYALQSSKMLRVALGPDILAAKGTMIAYLGGLQFKHEGAGSMAKVMKRVLTAEDQPLMRVSGQGQVFLARKAANIFTMQLEGEGISVGGHSLLAFDASLQWDIHRTGGAGMVGAGLFNTVVSGHGTVAVLSEGRPLILDCSQQPVFVDTGAAICWSANIAPGMVSSMTAMSLIGRGSGEAVQYQFYGPGFVVVQPSEFI
jgi:uncharacterized protein (AIM24 family)